MFSITISGMIQMKITLTGIDSRTDITNLPDVGGEYSLEYAILISRTKEGKEPRYPSYIKAAQMLNQLQDTQIMAAHLCGAPAREILAGQVPQELDWLRAGLVERIQVNANERDTLKGWETAAKIIQAHGIIPIFQWRRDTWPTFMDGKGVDVLLDRSGGRGIIEQNWPVRGSYKGNIGYAGGLGPDNLPLKLIVDAGKMPDNQSDLNIWIDMESSLRTNDWFDTKKALQVLMKMDDHFEYNYN